MTITMTAYEANKNLCFFLLGKTGSVNGRWQGRMKAKEQRELFGLFLGKGSLIIDGNDMTIVHIIKVCFGQDFTENAFVNYNKGTYRLANDSYQGPPQRYRSEY